MRKAGLKQCRERSGTCTYTSQRHGRALEYTVTGEQVGRRSHLSTSNRAGYSARQEASLSDRSTLQVRGVLRKSCMYIVPVQVQARSTEHGQAMVQIQLQFWKAKRRTHLSSDETFVLPNQLLLAWVDLQ
jgi:hypothetical protein